MAGETVATSLPRAGRPLDASRSLSLARAVLAEPCCAENTPSDAHELPARRRLQACSLMSKRKQAFDGKRILTAAEAAAYLGRSATWLAQHSARLQEAGFPHPRRSSAVTTKWRLITGLTVSATTPSMSASKRPGIVQRMAKVQIRYLVSKLRAGRRLYYWQPSRALRAAGFHSHRLSDDLETAICEAEALNHRLDDWRNGIEESPFKPETIPWLIRLYRADERYQRLAASTRRDYDQCLGIIENWSARAAARKAERPSMALAVLLGAYLGQREGDILLLTWAQYDGTTITLRQSKTGVLLPVPVASQLQAALDEALAQLREHDGEKADARAANVVALPKAKPAKATSAGDGPAGSTLGRAHGSADGSDLVLFESAVRQSPVILISESTSRAYKADHFRHEFRRIAKATGIGLQFLDLRRSAVVHLAEADCTIPQISAITGHQLDRTTRILETYLPRTAPMAKAAIHKLELYRKRTELEF